MIAPWARSPHRVLPACPGDDAWGGGLPENVEVSFALFDRFAVGIGALLGFEDKAVAFIGINPAKALGAVGFFLKHAALEHIVIMAIVGAAALGRIDANQRAKAIHETLRVREF